MDPDEQALRDHLRTGQFLAGVADGRWRLIDVTWPFTLVAVSAATRPGAPEEYALRLEVSGYPNNAPTGSLWDLASGRSLPADRRPKGQRAAQLFRADGWAGGATAMYAPWDRVGLETHASWAREHPRDAWNRNRDLSFVLRRVHEVLNADDYLGA